MRSWILAVTAAALVACGSAPSDEPLDSEGEDVTSAPIPLVLQFVGRYEDKSAAPGALESLKLYRSGRYRATFAGKASAETGSYHGPTRLPKDLLPLKLVLVTRGKQWKASIGAWNGAMTVTRDGSTSHLAAVDQVGPSEDLCDASGGSWTDDDVDPTTGLFCVCNAGKVYIPSSGGCVR